MEMLVGKSCINVRMVAYSVSMFVMGKGIVLEEKTKKTAWSTLDFSKKKQTLRYRSDIIAHSYYINTLKK